jgi:hypothetical protein
MTTNDRFEFGRAAAVGWARMAELEAVTARLAVGQVVEAQILAILRDESDWLLTAFDLEYIQGYRHGLRMFLDGAA